ncbi:diacylglycerol kinase family protein [Tabrizicola sp.]|uniref:diacylglycerol/lipid kinase family protein n=1 Tax=Tabrizicola sp. TaxID=2005166 RepID=UPI002732A8B1|nr:diacylglycerol kinase family protein [Tabrizicola sp.]MDP3195709.1 diacylglycerol kinase family protein [Tabrizicola sp.]
MPVRGPDICVLSNPRSGTALRNPGAVERAMQVFGPRAELRAFSGDPADEAMRALRDGFRIIVAAGGDGTVAGVAHALAGTDTALGVLPMGTFNYFARGLGLPEDAEAAAKAILDGSAHDIAVGTLNGRVFLNNVSIGLYPAILEEREATYARYGRYRILAHIASLRTILRFQRPYRMDILQDATRHRIRTPMLFVARSAYQLDQFGLEGAQAISDDRFVLFLAHQQTRLGFLRLAWRLVRRKVDHGRDVLVSTPRRIAVSVRGRRRISVALDGEKLKMEMPLRIRIADHQLQVIVPPAHPATGKTA